LSRGEKNFFLYKADCFYLTLGAVSLVESTPGTGFLIGIGLGFGYGHGVNVVYLLVLIGDF
jgi:hypothetical protein